MRTKFAINYSPQAAALLDARQISVDVFKCPDWPDLIHNARAHAPVYVHFPLTAGNNTLHKTDLKQVEALLNATQTAFVNVHLYASAAAFDGVALSRQDAGVIARVTEQLIAGVSVLCEAFGAERVIAENVIYRGYLADVLRACVLPDVICDVVNACQCGFLLDLSHARISHHYLQVDDRAYAAQKQALNTAEKTAQAAFWQYLSALPLHKLQELHITGIAFQHDKLMDHLALSDEDWAFTERLCSELAAGGADGTWQRPAVMAFEYGGIGPIFEWRSQRDVIAKQVPRLYELVSHMNQTGVASA